MGFQPVARYLGLLVAGFGIFPMLCIIFAFATRESGTIAGFAVSLACYLGVGGGLYLFGRAGGEPEALGRRQALVCVALAWALIPLLAAPPFVFATSRSWLDGVFESVSGFCTAGASIFTNVEVLPKSILLWRALTHWVGGVGIVGIFVAVMPEFGIGAKHMFFSESPGPQKEGFSPRVRSTAVRLVLIYLGLSAFFTVLLWLSGMGVFEAVIHMMAGLSTGGYSSRNASIGAFSDLTAVVVIVMLVVGGTNFTLFHSVLRGKKGVFRGSSEFRWYLAILVGSAALVSADYFLHGNRPSLGRSLLDGTFSVVSVQTTTGFATYDFDRGSSFSKWVLLGLMLVGGCAGSTSGGIKVSRLLICVKAAWIELLKAFHRYRIFPVRFDEQVLDADTRFNAFAILLWYLLCAGFSVLLTAAAGLDFEAAISGTLASLASVGPGFSVIGPMANYAAVPAFAKIVFLLDMLLGRLEFFPFLALILPSFWKK